MSNELKGLAEDLDKLLADVKPKPVVLPSVTEQQDVRQVSRAILEYVLHRAPENTVAEDIGTAIGIGVEAASAELNLKTEDLLSGIEEFVADALKQARASLGAKKR